MTMLSRFRRDETGAVMVEMTIAIVLLLTLTLGFVDFGNAYYQWNAATKAVQAGARMASISDPIAPEIRNAGSIEEDAQPGDPVPPGSYDFTCNGATSSCGGGTWVAANFNRIYFGDDDACDPVAGSRPGMCDFFPALEPGNVVVRYAASGLGYQTRPNGSIPTITVSLQDVNFQFFFLSGLLGFDDIEMPSMLSTVTGEDMRSIFP